MIARNEYIEKLKKLMWNNSVKVITGIRRCGKSTLLFDLFGDYLLRTLKIDTNSLIKIKLDEDENIKYRNPLLLSKYLKGIINDNNKKYYVFIDEIQLSKPKTDRKSGVKVSIFDVLNGLNNKKNVDVYVTGSNSKMLSKDIVTEFRGRTSQIRVHPFSFREYYAYRGGDESMRLNEYLLLGGMPELINKSFLFAYDGEEVSRVKDLVLKMTNEKMIEEAKKNHAHALDYDPELLDQKRSAFLGNAISITRETLGDE